MSYTPIIFCTFARESVRVCSRSAINASIMALASLGFAAWLVQEPQTCQPKGCEISLKYVFIMARPIKETPILYGEDARRFEARMKERRRISPEERAEMKATYEALKSVCDFM